MSMIEGVGEKFKIEMYFEARKKTMATVHEVASNVFLGMTEQDGMNLIDQVLEIKGVSRKWHPNKFRIGSNTTKSFREISDPVKLKKNDIFFIDIGPVFDEHEGDYGKTFVFGENAQYSKIMAACENVFHQTADQFKKNNLSGVELYRSAAQFTKSLGYVFDLKMSGHRLGDFPHSLFFKGSLAEADLTPKENLWVLEVLIKHPTENFGAFYEDIL